MNIIKILSKLIKMKYPKKSKNILKKNNNFIYNNNKEKNLQIYNDKQ